MKFYTSRNKCRCMPCCACRHAASIRKLFCPIECQFYVTECPAHCHFNMLSVGLCQRLLFRFDLVSEKNNKEEEVLPYLFNLTLTGSYNDS